MMISFIWRLSRHVEDIGDGFGDIEVSRNSGFIMRCGSLLLRRCASRHDIADRRRCSLFYFAAMNTALPARRALFAPGLQRRRFTGTLLLRHIRGHASPPMAIIIPR